MGHTYTAMLLHLVYSTSRRRPLLRGVDITRLIEFTGGLIRERNGKLLAMNGTEDHVHLLASLAPRLAVSEQIRDIKSLSTTWIRGTLRVDPFSWQEGYSAFSVSKSLQAAVERYIAAQVEHHRQHTFEQELSELLARAGLSYDPRSAMDWPSRSPLQGSDFSRSFTQGSASPSAPRHPGLLTVAPTGLSGNGHDNSHGRGRTTTAAAKQQRQRRPGGVVGLAASGEGWKVACFCLQKHGNGKDNDVPGQCPGLANDGSNGRPLRVPPPSDSLEVRHRICNGVPAVVGLAARGLGGCARPERKACGSPCYSRPLAKRASTFLNYPSRHTGGSR